MAFKMLDGNGAAVEAIKMARVKVISAYPITPQSSISEKLSELVVNKELDAEYVRVESEHTAMSVATTAQLTGVRAATATSSVGLALMHEILGLTSGCRVPIVMPVVNRALVSPWSLWCDHSDAMAERDTGWLQFYANNVQDVYDLTIMAYKTAENEKVLLPVMVCLDGFFLSHSMQKVNIPEQSEIDKFLGEYKPKNAYLTTEDPMFINDLQPPEDFTELKYQHAMAIENSFDVINEVMADFNNTFGRKSSIIEEYLIDDADAVLITMGSMSGTAKYTINQMRSKGFKVGLMRIVVFRPFPYNRIKEALKGKKVVGVLDRSVSLGSQGGAVCLEVRSALKDSDTDVRQYIGGLGGRDISESTIKKIFEELLEIKEGKSDKHSTWIDVKGNAMNLREVLKLV